jgi:hypothetical protein
MKKKKKKKKKNEKKNEKKKEKKKKKKKKKKKLFYSLNTVDTLQLHLTNADIQDNPSRTEPQYTLYLIY